MTAIEELTKELSETLPGELNVQIPCAETDLFDEGILDSLGLIEILFLMDKRWGVSVSVDQLELDNFRSLVKIAEFIDKSRSSQ